MTEVQTAAETSPRAASNRPSIYKIKPCLECGSEFQQFRAGEAFCTGSCRKVWNNRRAVRGAQLYDLFMNLRFNREEASDEQVWSAMTRLSAEFRANDVAERSGRRSFRTIAASLGDMPWLKAVVNRIRAGR